MKSNAGLSRLILTNGTSVNLDHQEREQRVKCLLNKLRQGTTTNSQYTDLPTYILRFVHLSYMNMVISCL